MLLLYRQATLLFEIEVHTEETYTRRGAYTRNLTMDVDSIRVSVLP